MPFSIGIIGRIDDEITFSELKNFLEMLQGFNLIYITRTKESKLYVIDRKRLDRLGANLYKKEVGNE